MPDRRVRLRLWLLAMDRFELRLRGKAGRERNSFIRDAANAYVQNGSLPAWILERHRRNLFALLTDHYDAVIPYFGAMALDQIKSRRISRKEQKDYFQHFMREWTATQALTKAKLIASTDADDVRDAIQDGITERLGTEEIGRAIRKVTSLTPFRAATVARTETHAAATFGSIESVRQAEQELGIVMLKEWLPTLDDRTRPDHAAMEGSDPIPMGEKFIVGGFMMDRPGDPSAPPEQTINCRCALAYEEANN